MGSREARIEGTSCRPANKPCSDEMPALHGHSIASAGSRQEPASLASGNRIGDTLAPLRPPEAVPCTARSP